MGLKQVSFVERSSLSQRLPHRRFHCIQVCSYVPVGSPGPPVVESAAREPVTSADDLREKEKRTRMRREERKRKRDEEKAGRERERESNRPGVDLLG